jgi:Ca2+-binding EF-hand superfamily protein
VQTSEFLDRKLTKRFKCWDTNNSGTITRQDFRNAADRMVHEFGTAPNRPDAQALSERCMQVWHALSDIADLNADGSITEEEFKKAFTSLILDEPDNFDKAYTPLIDALFAIADTDGDGQVSKAEYVRYYNAFLNVPEGDSSEAFRKLDQDGSGKLSRSELIESVRDFYFSEDTDAAGNYILGSV